MTRVILAAMLLFTFSGKAQENCNLSISGRVIDEHDGTALVFAEIVLVETGQGAITDSLGNYRFSSLCPGDYHLRAFHMGCDPLERSIRLSQDLENVDFYLEHHHEELEEIMLIGQHIRRDSKPITLLQKEDLMQVQQLGLNTLSEQVASVNMLNAGNNIVKPVIHGMYGNRVTTSVDGVGLEDQQWGREHGLSIDPAVAGYMAVVSGPAAVEYGPGALGGVLIVDPKKVPYKGMIGGALELQGQTNGRGGRIRLSLEDGNKGKWGWRSQLSFTRLGDQSAPDYNLTNTGLAEIGYQLQLGYKRKKLQGRLGYSLNHRNLAVLLAANTGNLTDLEEAIQRSEPLAQDPFSYQINPPRQEVAHHMLTTDWQYRTGKHSFWQMRYALQLNQRREYDFRRGLDDDVPANDLRLITHSADLKYQTNYGTQWQAKYGLSSVIQINSNIPGTGIRPILPNYNRYRVGAFAIFEWEVERWVLQAGLRYDFEYTLAQKFDRQNQLQKPEFQYHIPGVNLGATFRINQYWQYSTNLAVGSRPPHVIELLSEGLHHGAASIELGDSSLKPEHAVNWSQTLKWIPSEKFRVEITAYISPVRNYIFQVADSVPQLTIRGAFPVWNYTQSDALLGGMDLTVYLKLSSRWHYRLIGNYVRGYDVENDEDLILMPPPRISQRLTYDFTENLHADLESQLVAEQRHFAPDLDLAPPPPAYHLLHAGISWQISEYFETSLQIRNLTNRRYRDYLDRFRYFADRPGINFVLNLKYQF